MLEIMSDGLPIKSWCMTPEEKAIEQAKNLARLPFAYRHIALMPDTHMGYGMPIGGVLATASVVIPNAVGVDIGCGMIAVKSDLTEISIDHIKKIMGLIRENIPVGFNHNPTKVDESVMPVVGMETLPVVQTEFENARYQIGTLGGGNHFIEIQKSFGSIWVMIHTGSRNLGYKVAEHYNLIACELNEKYYSKVDPKWELAFLPMDSKEGMSYIREMKYCVEFAHANRLTMIGIIKDIISGITGANFEKPINIAHNYARLENHFGHNVMVHRKGATSAYAGEIGIIPGSQGTTSYIVEGLGNRDSFMSCSHGAGRRMGRKEAQRTLNLDEEKAKMDAQGIVHGIRNASDLDEAAGAYKDISVVMEEQKDLVKPLVTLKPLAVIKG